MKSAFVFLLVLLLLGSQGVEAGIFNRAPLVRGEISELQSQVGANIGLLNTYYEGDHRFSHMGLVGLGSVWRASDVSQITLGLSSAYSTAAIGFSDGTLATYITVVDFSLEGDQLVGELPSGDKIFFQYGYSYLGAKIETNFRSFEQTTRRDFYLLGIGLLSKSGLSGLGVRVSPTSAPIWVVHSNYPL